MSRSLDRSRRKAMREAWLREIESASTPPFTPLWEREAFVHPHTLIQGCTLRTFTTTYRGAYPTRAAVQIFREISGLTASVGTDTV